MSQLFRYIAVGAFNTALGYAIIFFCMYALNIGPIVSNILGYAVCLSISYVLNKFYTFRAPSRSMSEVLRFVLVFMVSYGSNLLALYVLIDYLKIHEGLSQVLSGVVYVGASFVLNKYYVFETPRLPSPVDRPPF